MPAVPRHAQRVARILGRVPKPAYNVAVDGHWIGNYVSTGVGRFYAVADWKNRGRAIRAGRRALQRGGRTIEVFEAYGSFPEDRKVVYRMGNPKSARVRGEGFPIALPRRMRPAEGVLD